ncbi:transketolase, partial [Patescibacteria group bacterium]|nr:transketolase [Patescibacteria group bacterium]
MLKEIPQFGATLSEDQISFMQAFTKSCRHTIVSMLKNSQSGHPGGSLSSLDYLATLYAFILSQTGEQIVVSHGHISPAVYSVLAELSYIPKEDVIESFRKFGSPYEGHVSRHVPGIFYGTGPLGVGVSAAASFALAEKLKGTSRKAYALMGDGEMQEGQVYEMINFAAHHKLDNLVLFVDYNKVQLTDKLSEVQNINIPEIFKAGGFEVIETDAHDFQDIWAALSKAHHSNKPVCILGHSIMGKGVPFMEVDGAAYKSDWHGKPPKPEQADDVLPELKPNEEEYATIQSIQQFIKWKPEANHLPESLTKMEVDTGEPALYDNDNTTDCRSAYGKALADLAERNPKVLALSADLKGSNMTKFASEQAPAQHIECGIAE